MLLCLGGCGFSPSPTTKLEQDFNAKWKADFTNSCVATVSLDNPKPVADRFCDCVEGQLDGLSMREKMATPVEKTEAAQTYCKAHG